MKKRRDTEHSWEKKNLFTLLKGYRPYDNYQCLNCGAKAKRWGFGNIVIDKRFKENCSNKLAMKSE